MKYIDSLPVKYITENHRFFKNYPNDSIDVIFDLSKEIIKSKKSKKNWSSKDFIFDESMIKSLFNERFDEIIDILLSNNYVIKNDETSLYSITELGLSLVYNF